jgi:ferritin-like metal-binding protein YciE
MDFGTEEFWKKVSDLRFDLIGLAAKNNKNIIMTLCYEPGDEHYIEKLKTITARNNSQIYYVKLECSHDQLKQRVTEESRKSHGKIKTVDEIEESLKKHDYSQTIKEPNSIVIENNNVTAEEAADKIIESFGL